MEIKINNDNKKFKLIDHSYSRFSKLYLNLGEDFIIYNICIQHESVFLLNNNDELIGIFENEYDIIDNHPHFHWNIINDNSSFIDILTYTMNDYIEYDNTILFDMDDMDIVLLEINMLQNNLTHIDDQILDIIMECPLNMDVIEKVEWIISLELTWNDIPKYYKSNYNKEVIFYNDCMKKYNKYYPTKLDGLYYISTIDNHESNKENFVGILFKTNEEIYKMINKK